MSSLKVRPLGVSLVLLLGACFHTTAPEGWLPTPAVAQQEAFGGWIRVEYTDGGARTVEGELIAAGADSLHVLTTDSLVSLAIGAVSSATLTAYDSQYGRIVNWTFLGALGTLSNGWISILTLPLWAIVGTSSAASASRGPRVQSLEAALLRPYARFPQGLPDGVDRDALRPKRVPIS
jgi:hypothetical protein